MTLLAAAPSSSSRRDGFLVLCLLATWLIWGSTYLAIKFALVSFPPFFQMGSRFLLAGALLMGWVAWRGGPWPTLKQWGHALIVGTLMLGGGMGGTAVAEQSVGSGLVVAFLAATPMVIALLNRLWGVRSTWREILGIAVGMLGVLLLVRGAGFSAAPQGLLAIATASASWSLGSVLSQRRFPLAPGASGFASEMLCGGVVLMGLSVASGERFVWPPEPLALGAWLYLVVFGSLVAFNAYMILLARAPASLAASYAYVNPVIALLLGVTFGGEAITAGEWGAAGVVLCGVLLLLWRPAARA